MSFDPVSMGVEAAGGLLSGLFSDNTPQLPPELAALYKYLMKLSKQQYQFSKGVPGSSPGELAALSQAKGLAGQDFANGRQQLMAGLGINNLQNAPDALQRFSSNQASALSGIDTNMLQQFLAARQNAVGQAANIAQGAGGAAHGYYQPNEPLGGLFSQLAQQVAYQRGTQGQQGGGSIFQSNPYAQPNVPSMPLPAPIAVGGSGSYIDGSRDSMPSMTWDPNRAPSGFGG